MQILSDKQASLYSMYTAYGERCGKRLKEIDAILEKSRDDQDGVDIIQLIEERDLMKRRICYASDRRMEVENARTAYENHLAEAARLKAEYNL